KWSEEVEAEAFAVLTTLEPAETTDASGAKIPVSEAVRAAGLVPRLYQLVDAMISRRAQAAQQALQDQGGVDEATRTERTATAADVVKSAREAVADRLDRFRAEQQEPMPTLADWILAERIYLDILLERNRADSVKWAWNIVGDAPPEFVPPVNGQDDEAIPSFDPQQAERLVKSQLEQALKQRAWITLLNLAARRNAGERLTERVLAYIDGAIQSAADATAWANEQLEKEEEDATEEDRVDYTIGWKLTKSNALILFDRPDDLAATLRQWIAQDKWNLPWRRSLAMLLAERGELQEAVTMLESVERDDQLSPQEYTALANWYLVIDQRENHERCRIASFAAAPDYQLNQLLHQKYNQINSGQAPTELDEETLFIVQALFQKTSNPTSYYHTIRNLYTATRDFGLLQMISETMLGHSQERAYQAISGLQGSLISEVRNEATADEILQHLHRLRDQINNGWVPRGAEPNARSLALDLRALDLLESMMERKASEVLNQPGPHGQAALTAFRRAFSHEWQEGERRQYARLLEQMGAVTNERNHPVLTPLANEQLRQLQQLYDDSEAGSADRAYIGMIHSLLLFYSYGRQDEGLLRAESTLREYAAAHEGLVPYSENDLVQQYSRELQKLNRFRDAEDYVQKHLDNLTANEMRWTYISHLNQLHDQAFRAGGRTSLGEGRQLFHALLQRLEDQCDTKFDHQRYQALQLTGSVFNHAIQHRQDVVPEAADRLLEFANQRLHSLLQAQQDNYGNLVEHFDQIINDRIDVLAALEFLIGQFEKYPIRFQFGHQHPWQQLGWRLGQHRLYADQLTSADTKRADQRGRFEKLESRLLPIVLQELRADLVNLQGRNQALYHIGNSYFWNAKAKDFLRVAED
ncbi:MAG: hypothetical protein KDA96_22795, partial [Planctomycetaceae bacterium]|nr:hypothetical protein [Planctomycetaceae bacterium]